MVIFSLAQEIAFLKPCFAFHFYLQYLCLEAIICMAFLCSA